VAAGAGQRARGRVREGRAGAAGIWGRGEVSPTIYHGTPLTPQPALMNVLDGRAACVSFYRPDNVEAVEGVCPYIMFRSRRVLILDGRYARRARMGSGEPRRLVGSLLSLAGTTSVLAGPMGDHPGQPRRSVADQRRIAERLAVREIERRPGVAHGRAGRTAREAMRALRPCLPGLDRTSKEGACRLRRIPPQDGGSVGSHGQQLASFAPAPRITRGVRLSLRWSRRDNLGAERTSL
jgi:hypothetical protein